MKLSDAAKAFLSRCYNSKGERMSVSGRFNERYTIEGKEYKFTKKVYQELLESDMVKIIYEGEHSVNLMGVRK